MRFLRKEVILILLFLILCSNINLSYSDTNNPKSSTDLNQINIEENMINSKKITDDLLDTLNDFGREIHVNSQKRYYDCLKAIGNIKFCKCLSNNLPYVLTFQDYVIIMTTDKSILLEAEKQNRKDEMQSISKVIDKTINVRNTCVTQFN